MTPKPTLTPAQQAIVDKMAKGAYGAYRSDSGGAWLRLLNRYGGFISTVRRDTFRALTDSGVIGFISPQDRYTLTPLGLSLARKDGENELPKM